MNGFLLITAYLLSPLHYSLIMHEKKRCESDFILDTNCQLSLTNVSSFLDALLCVYLIPFSFIFIIYIIILRFHRIHTLTNVRQNITQ